jgi:hypothetical protein
LADYLTRQGLPKGDLEKLDLKNVQISDFYHMLPKEEFTLAEWAQFCADNPQYLTINSVETPSIHAVSFSLDQGIKNLNDQIDPLIILKERLSRDNLIENQQKEFPEIIKQCLDSKDFVFSDEKNSYKIDFNLLYILEDEIYKIYIPPSMVGLIISYIHLHGHWGVAKMVANMKMYYFPNMYSTVKKFVSCCYACFLQNSSSRQNVLGLYPTPEHPFEEISMDLCENLNKINGYSHLLVIQDVLTDFLIVEPLKSKTSTEMARIFMYGVLQNFNVKRIHTDNGPVFRNSSWLSLMASLKITVINSSSQNPSARGKAEKAVHIVKTMLKKMTSTASSGTLNWECLPYLVTKIFNHTIVPRTGFTPSQMIFGKTELSKSQLSLENATIMHHYIRNNTVKLNNLSRDLNKMSQLARKTLNDMKVERNDYANLNKVKKIFKENDIVFVLDRYNLPGNSRPLKTKFYASPCVVIKQYHTTTLVQRIADGFKSLYSNNDLKLFKGGNPFFKSLPKEIKRILLHDFQNLLEPDFNTITKLDPLNVPPAISLIDTVDKNSSTPYLREGHPATDKNISSTDVIQDPGPDPQIEHLSTVPKTNTPVDEHDSDSEIEEENKNDPEPDPDPDSDTETLVNEETNTKQLRSGKSY